MKFHFVKREYLNDVGANKAKTTYKSFQAALNRYGRFLASEGQPDPGCEFALAFETVQQYKFSLMKSGVKKKGGLLGQTVRAQLCPLSGMCSYMIRMRIMDPHENPFEKMELPDRKTAVRLLVSDEEVAGLLNGSERQADPKRVAFSRLLVSALVHTGVRAEELSNIEIGHISLEQETLEVRYGKGSKNRILNPPREFFIALEGWLPFRDPDRLYCEGLARIRGVGPHARISPRRGHWPSHAPVPASHPVAPKDRDVAARAEFDALGDKDRSEWEALATKKITARGFSLRPGPLGSKIIAQEAYALWHSARTGRVPPEQTETA